MINLPQSDSNISVWLQLDGQDYELSQFNIVFSQSGDAKGEPQDAVRGGLMLMTLTQTLPDSMYAWAMKSTTKKGVIDFRIESGSSPFKVEFENAFCLGFQRMINTEGGGVTTALTVSPEELRINGMSFDNRWTNN